MNELISVIVPVYNAQNYLEECLESILNQTYKNIEIICINDGSKDKSLEIIKKYIFLDKRIKLIDKIKNYYIYKLKIFKYIRKKIKLKKLLKKINELKN